MPEESELLIDTIRKEIESRLNFTYLIWILEGLNMIENKTIIKAIKEIVYPVLSEYGFEKMKGRDFYKYFKNGVFVLSLPALGAYLGNSIIQFPSTSIHVFYGVYFYDLDSFDNKNLKVDKDGKLIPKYWDCDPFKSSLNKSINQQKHLNKRKRTNEFMIELVPHVEDDERIWYVDDLETLNESILNIVENIKEKILNKIDYFCSLDFANDFLNKYHDCLIKYYYKTMINKITDNAQEYEKYLKLYEDKIHELNSRNNFTQHEINPTVYK